MPAHRAYLLIRLTDTYTPKQNLQGTFPLEAYGRLYPVVDGYSPSISFSINATDRLRAATSHCTMSHTRAKSMPK